MDLLNRNAFNMHHVDFYGHSDADMLEIGNGQLNHEQERTHFALWAAMKSPLLIGTDLSKIPQPSLDILKTKLILAFHQDPNIGKPAQPFKWDRSFDPQNRPPQYWAGNYTDGTMVWLFNSNSSPTTLSVLTTEIPDLVGSKRYSVTDAWTGAEVGCMSDGLVAKDVAPYDTAVFVVQPSNCKAGYTRQDLQNPLGQS